jgi:hypothetical protein
MAEVLIAVSNPIYSTYHRCKMRRKSHVRPSMSIHLLVFEHGKMTIYGWTVMEIAEAAFDEPESHKSLYDL